MEIGEEIGGHKEMFLMYDINLGVFLLKSELAQGFLRIIPLISDESDNLGDIALGEPDGAVIGLFVEVSDDFPLEEG